jgi:hypothetical protein
VRYLWKVFVRRTDNETTVSHLLSRDKNGQLP